MARNRTKLGLTALLIFLMGAAASAQGLRDMQIFATADQSRYGGGHRPNEGYFFAFDGLVWSIGSPDATDVGRNDLTRNVVYVPEDGFTDPPTAGRPYPVTVESSSLSTGAFENEFTGGNRYDFGYMTGHHGWMFSAFYLQDINQEIYGSNASVVLQDAPLGLPIPVLGPDGGVSAITGRLDGYYYYDDDLTDGDDSSGGPLPVRFDELTVRNTVEMWNVEWDYIYRFHPGHHSGILEMRAGVRYLEFNEIFGVEGIGYEDDTATATVPSGILNDSLWTTWADNHIIGGQIGLRWFRRQNRWTWEVESRFFAGYNAQSINQRATIASRLQQYQTAPPTPGVPVKMSGTVRSDSEFNIGVFSPNAEFRVNLKYQLTRSVTCRVGWTGLWLNGIARPSNMVDYSLNADGSIFGILEQNNQQSVFINGISFGIDLNR